MFPASDPNILAQRSHRPRPGWPRRGAPGKQRPSFRPELEPIEDRCLLSSYNVPIDLGTLGASNLRSGATSINNATGQVVGWSQVVSGDDTSYHPFLWTAGGTDGVPSNPRMKDLGGLIPGGNGQAWDVNDSGQVVGFTDPPDVNGNPAGRHIFLWTPGGTDGVPSNPQMKDLPIAWGGLHFLAINNSGVVVGNEVTNAGPYHAFVWDQARGVRDLNELVPSDLGVELRYAADVNNQGQIAATGWNIGGTSHAYLLFDSNNDGDYKDPNEVTDLGTLHGADYAGAYAINDVGQVAGGSGGNAFIWQNGVMKSLGQFQKEGPSASGINHSSVVVGYTEHHGAWAWTGSGKIQGLNDLIPSNSGWNLLDAFGISDAGTIVGYGTPTSGGPGHAFLVTPTSARTVALTTSAASLTDAKTASLSPVEAGARSPHPLTDALRRAPGPPDSPILIALTPPSEQDLTPFVTEFIRPGTKRPRPSLRG
jgi:probable HAF family extracellular repeat protein